VSRIRRPGGVSVAAQLAEIPDLSRARLVELWVEHLGQAPPRASSTSFILRAVAYAVQEQAYGGLKSSELRALLKLVPTRGDEQAAGRQQKRKKESDEPHSKTGAIARAKEEHADEPPVSTIRLSLQPGTRLVRDWQGKSYTVDVHADGFGWNGKIYRSLSAVATAITGARWSGNRFFRLDR
jgi:hypothetical protein